MEYAKAENKLGVIHCSIKFLLNQLKSKNLVYLVKHQESTKP